MTAKQLTNSTSSILKNQRGITMIEIVLTAAIIFIFAGLILPWQMSSWKRTSGYARTTTACQQIERQIEQRRIMISMDPDTNFVRFKNLTDTVIWDSLSKPPIKYMWTMSDAKDRFGDVLANVRSVKITATLSATDSIVVTTTIAKNF